MPIIAISGHIGSGKDEVAKIIKHYQPLQWDVKKFAGKLKKIVSELTGISVEDLENQSIKDSDLGDHWAKWAVTDFGRATRFSFSDPREANTFCEENSNSQHDYSFHEKRMTVRELLQIMGTECGRQIIHDQIWVNSLFADYKPIFNPWNRINAERYPRWIITDCRFPNEAKAVKDRNGVLIRINRPSAGSETSKKHESETALDDYGKWDFIINNDGSLEQLEDKVKNILPNICLILE